MEEENNTAPMPEAAPIEPKPLEEQLKEVEENAAPAPEEGEAQA